MSAENASNCRKSPTNGAAREVSDEELETRINDACRRMIAAGKDKILANAWGEIMVSMIRRRSPEQVTKMEIERGLYR
jgi:hypothetical protein